MQFYKTCSKKFGLNISLSIPIQRHKNTSAYDTQGVKNFNILPFVSSSPMRNMAEDPEKWYAVFQFKSCFKIFDT